MTRRRSRGRTDEVGRITAPGYGEERSGDVPLSEAERRALERLVSAPSTPQALALRARIVLSSEQEPISTVARSVGVSRNTVMKWRTRFSTDGVRGLEDLPRPGRPTKAGDGFHRAILRMPLQRPPERGWTTRTIAEALGTSQASVSRVRRQWFADRTDLISHSVLNSSSLMVLAAVVIDPRVRVLVFHQPATPAARPRSRPASQLATASCHRISASPVPGMSRMRACRTMSSRASFAGARRDDPFVATRRNSRAPRGPRAV